jgi:N-acetylmuramoyl-L-alanine amidase
MSSSNDRGIRRLYSLITAHILAVSILSLPEEAILKRTPINVFIDKRHFAPDMTFLADSTTYVPLRDFCRVMDDNAKISWDDKENTIYVSTDKLNLSVKVGQTYLIANGRYLYLDKPCYISQGTAMIPIRVIAKAFDAEVSWNGQLKQVAVTLGSGAIEQGDIFYNKDNLYWLSRIINAEARGESLAGQIAVGNVVLNRLNAENWPDTVYEVVFDTRCGVQFSPTANGTIYNEPSESAVIAAKLALDGAQVVGGSLFFLNKAKATSRWIINNCRYVTTIGSHSFYM